MLRGRAGVRDLASETDYLVQHVLVGLVVLVRSRTLSRVVVVVVTMLVQRSVATAKLNMGVASTALCASLLSTCTTTSTCEAEEEEERGRSSCFRFLFCSASCVGALL
jgi:hypothetical protein